MGFPRFGQEYAKWQGITMAKNCGGLPSGVLLRRAEVVPVLPGAQVVCRHLLVVQREHESDDIVDFLFAQAQLAHFIVIEVAADFRLGPAPRSR